MKNHVLLAIIFVLFATALSGQKQYVLQSPDGKLKITVSVDKNILYEVNHSGDVLINPSPISMQLLDGRVLGTEAKVSGSKIIRIDQEIASPIYKKALVKDHYNELSLRFKGNYGLIFRAYDDGMAYRFVTDFKTPFIVKNEQVVYHFPSDNKSYFSYVRGNHETIEPQFFNSFENTCEIIPLSQWNKNKLTFLPALVAITDTKKVCLTEADLLNYPGMYLRNTDGTTSLEGVFAPYPKNVENGGHNNLQGIVKSREDFIAKCEGKTLFPWRAMIVAERDADLTNSDMVYKLATPAQNTDYSWIKPGKVAWDWWNDWNVFGVDFKSGVNNDTYKYYIDFASANHIAYVILDEGWAVNLKADLMQVVPEINLKELVDYAATKNVGIILWAGYYAFDRDMERVCSHYSEMGVKGFKVDFMDRDDQLMVDFHARAARMGAKYKLLIDFHGTYKPTGLQRTYPNVINFEGVNGLEQLKWASPDDDQVTYDLMIPFMRMVAGPLDYTQGAMRNASRDNFRSVNSEAMSQGTRCRQLAEYIVFESPLSMMCDNPSNYLQEKECLDFIASVPTTWDNTVAMDGKIGEYVAIARQKGTDWYVGAITDWSARALELDLSFLGEGVFRAEVFRDGVNAHRVGRDYKKEVVTIPACKKLKISMAPGGGYVMRIFPER